MPHVASDPKISPLHSHRPPSRTAPAESASSSPFAALIEDAPATPPARDNRQANKTDAKAAPEKTAPKAEAKSRDDAQQKGESKSDAEPSSDTAAQTGESETKESDAKLKAALLEAAAKLGTDKPAAETVDPLRAAQADEAPEAAPAVAAVIAAAAVPEQPVTAKPAETPAPVSIQAASAEPQAETETVPLELHAPVTAKAQPADADKTDIATQADAKSGDAKPAQQTPTAAQLDALQAKAPDSAPDARPVDIAQPQAISSTTAASAAAPARGPDTQTPAVPLNGVAMEITNRAMLGKSRFEIRLDPPELGRIDVRLDVDRHGNVSSRLIVERPETLHMLRHDAPALERALQDAGLKTTDNGLQFSLRDQSQQHDGNSAHDSASVIVTDDTADLEPAARAYARPAGPGGVDIHV